MGCQVDTIHDILCYNVSARLVIEMCSLWYEVSRDSDGCSTQVKIDSTSVHIANQEVPRTYTEYVQWRSINGLGRWYDNKRFFDEEDFLAAREFIVKSAQHRVDVRVYI